MNDFEKRWQRIQEALQLELTGDERPLVSSGRTLFDIRSEAEEKMERWAREIEEEHANRRAQRHDEEPTDEGGETD